MAFSEHLQHIVKEVDGAIACSVMGFDGIAVETVQKDSTGEAASALELSNSWVEFANVVSQLRQAAQNLKTGAIAEIAVSSEKVVTLMRLVASDYFIVLGLLPTGNYGKARYVLRIKAPEIAKEL